MSPLLTAVLVVTVLVVLITPAFLIVREIRVHRQETALRARLLEQARPLLLSSRCAACGGALSTWDGGLTPLPSGVHVAPADRRHSVVECAAHRECLGCGHLFELHFWSDGQNWGFREAVPPA